MDLVEQYPNDQQLGSKVRQFYWEQRKNVTDPNQIDLFEDEDTRDDAILGYD